MLIARLLPDFLAEMQELLRAQGHPDLAAQCAQLDITAPCGCGDDFCGGFYTGARPDGSWGPGHLNIVLEPSSGDIILDVVDGKIRFVEVLFRDEIRNAINRAFPP